MYFKMADVSLHLSLQHYTILPPLLKAEEDTVLRLERGRFLTIFDDFFEFFIFRSRSRHMFNSFSKFLIARIHVHCARLRNVINGNSCSTQLKPKGHNGVNVTSNERLILT